MDSGGDDLLPHALQLLQVHVALLVDLVVIVAQLTCDVTQQ